MFDTQVSFDSFHTPHVWFTQWLGTDILGEDEERFQVGLFCATCRSLLKISTYTICVAHMMAGNKHSRGEEDHERFQVGLFCSTRRSLLTFSTYTSGVVHRVARNRHSRRGPRTCAQSTSRADAVPARVSGPGV